MENEFQYRFLKALAAKGITAAELSRQTGINKVAIHKYIKGAYIPKQDKCYLLAKALDVDPGWLMTGEEPTSKPDTFVFQDSKELVKLITAMTPDDYTMVMAAIDRTYKRLKAEGKM